MRRATVERRSTVSTGLSQPRIRSTPVHIPESSQAYLRLLGLVQVLLKNNVRTAVNSNAQGAVVEELTKVVQLSSFAEPHQRSPPDASVFGCDHLQSRNVSAQNVDPRRERISHRTQGNFRDRSHKGSGFLRSKCGASTIPRATLYQDFRKMKPGQKDR